MSLGQDGKGVTEVTPSGSSYLERTLYTFFFPHNETLECPRVVVSWNLGLSYSLLYVCEGTP